MKMVFTLLAATAAVISAPSATAATIVASSTGLTNPQTTINFDEVALASGTSVTNQFASFGLTIDPSLSYTPQTGFPNITGNTLGNFSPSVSGPVTLKFASSLTAAGFNMVSNSSTYSFQALLGGVVIESFQSAVGSSSASNFYGFTGSNFDAIRINNLSGDSYLIDNVQLGVTSAVPEPATWAMMLLGLGFVGGSLRSRRRQRTAVSFG
jgi:hypothetical protein